MCDDARLNDELSEARHTIARLTRQLRAARVDLVETARIHGNTLHALDMQGQTHARQNLRHIVARQRDQITTFQAENDRIGTKLALAMNELAAQARRIAYLQNKHPVTLHDPDAT